MQKKSYPKLLVVANQCLSLQTSNGRTLRNFLKGWPLECIAQFCTQMVAPDFSTCEKFCCITDKFTLKSFLGKIDENSIFPSKDFFTNESYEKSVQKTQRNALTMLLREVAWRSKQWMSRNVKKWLDTFNPQVILLQAGDSPFMFWLARKWSKQYKAPLIIYNSEGYYFKDYDYFRTTGLTHIIYPMFHSFFCKEFRTTLKVAKKTVYICDSLREDYDSIFHLPSETIYTATEIQPRTSVSEHEGFISSYFGNLGVGRHKSLIEIANALQLVSPNLFLDVYGRIPNDEVKYAFEQCKGIRYNGFISYSDVVKKMNSSDLLIHCESFDEFYRKDSKYAFSTKIADSLASGVPLLIYAPKEFAITKYLRKNNAAFVACDYESLKEKINLILNRPNEIQHLLNQARSLLNDKHNAEKNSKLFQQKLLESVKV